MRKNKYFRAMKEGKLEGNLLGELLLLQKHDGDNQFEIGTYLHTTFQKNYCEHI